MRHQVSYALRFSILIKFYHLITPNADSVLLLSVLLLKHILKPYV